MKHKRAGRKGWARVLSDSEQIIPVAGGIIVDYRAGEVVRPLDVPFRGRTIRILDTGYRWIHYAPAATHHALTVQLDAQDVPQQIYVDICEEHGTDPDGIPCITDLYLDVIALCDVLPDGRWHVTETEIIDQDELDEALQAKTITRAQYDLAWAEAKRVENALHRQAFAPLRSIWAYLHET